METARRLGPAQINRVPAETLLDLGVLTGLVDDQLEPLGPKR
ncbi:MAG: hypothetical protein JWP35_3603 [Caulobacter sp.]|nr:hypothetical protein [Caulobacter sp.]